MKRLRTKTQIQECCTGISDTDVLILTYLNLDDLRHVGATCKYLRMIYQDQQLWQYKVYLEFGTEVCQYKPATLSFRQQYMDLTNLNFKSKLCSTRSDLFLARRNQYYVMNQMDIINLIGEGNLEIFNFIGRIILYQEHIQIMIQKGYLNMLKHLGRCGMSFTEDHLELALKHDQDAVATWFWNLGIKPTSAGIDYAVKYNYAKLVKICAQRSSPILPTSTGANYAAANNNLNALEWMYALNTPVLPTRAAADHAVEAGHWELLEWLMQRNIHPTSDALKYLAGKGNLCNLQYMFEHTRLRPSCKVANVAAKNGHLHILLWLASSLLNKYKLVIPTQKGATDAAKFKHASVVVWLAEKGVYPNVHGCNHLVELGNLDLLKSLPINPSFTGANCALENGYVHILDWMSTLDPPVYPTHLSKVKFALYKGHLQTYYWVQKHCAHLIPKRLNVDDANQVAMHGNIHILNWLAQGNFRDKIILPNTIGMQMAALKGHLEVLKWGVKHKITLDVKVANTATEYNQLEALKWLVSKYQLWPNQNGMAMAVGHGSHNTLSWLYKQKRLNILGTLKASEKLGLHSSHAKQALAHKLTVYSPFKRQALSHYLKYIDDADQRQRALNWLCN